MRIFSLNCRGASYDHFVRVLREFLGQERLEIVIVLKPHTSGARAKAMCRKFRELSALRVEALGLVEPFAREYHAGGLPFLGCSSSC